MESSYPNDLKIRAAIDRFFSWAHFNLYAPVGLLVFNEIYKPNNKSEPDKKLTETNLKKLSESLLQFKTFLKDSAFIGGQEVSIADF